GPGLLDRLGVGPGGWRRPIGARSLERIEREVEAGTALLLQGRLVEFQAGRRIDSLPDGSGLWLGTSVRVERTGVDLGASRPDLGFEPGAAAPPVSSDIPNRSSTSSRVPALPLAGDGGCEARAAPRGGLAGAGEEPIGPAPPRRDGATGGSSEDRSMVLPEVA